MTRAIRWPMFTRHSLFLSIASVSFLFAATLSCRGTTPDKQASIEGTWILKSIYKTGNDTAIDSAQQKSLLNSRITYTSKSMTACHQATPITSVDIAERSTANFYADTNVGAKEVDLSGPTVTEITINKTQSGNCFGTYTLPGEDVYLKGKNEILVNFGGVFYRAVRAQ